MPENTTPAACWWDNQPDPVRAVLDLAAMRDGAIDSDGYVDDAAHDRVLALFAGEHADAIRGLARSLYWIDRFAWDDGAEALNAFHGTATRWVYADQAADECSARLQADALTTAQLVASLIRRPARTAVPA